jgi:hypothetical protein
MVIAARGSGEQPQPNPDGPGKPWHGTWSDPVAYTYPDTYYGVGEFNYDVYQALADTGSPLRFSLDPVRYPADPGREAWTDPKTYQASAAAGAYSIVTDISRTRAACGDQVRFVLAGYSQGAWSVHKALYALDAQKDGSLNLISAVTLFGDPEFQPGLVIDRGSQKGLTNYGLATPIDVSSRSVPASLQTKTADYCLPRDPICQGVSPVTGLWPFPKYFLHCVKVNWAEGKCPHTSYKTSGATAQAAAFIRPLLPAISLRDTDDLVLVQQDPQGFTHIVYRKSDGSETALTSFNKDTAQTPDVSLNGTRIAFVDGLYTYNSSGQITGGGEGIWVMNLDGSGQRQLTFPDITAADTSSLNFEDGAPRWSPDGTKLVFARHSPAGGSHIDVMNIDGTGVTDLTPNAYVDLSPAWSPDGSQIAYIAVNAAGYGQVWVMNADGANPHLVDPSSPSICWATDMDWASNSRIYTWRSCTGEMYLSYLTSSDSFGDAAFSTETDITPPFGTGSVGNAAVSSLRASADGNRLYFTMGGGSTVYNYSYGSQTGWTQNRITSGELDLQPTPVKVAAAS